VTQFFIYDYETGEFDMFRVKLTFCSDGAIELLRVDLSNVGGTTCTSVRGKTSGAFRGAGTFQWSSAVRAVACIFIQAKLKDEETAGEAMLSGEAKSLAASLDYALTKQPAWLLDMFGTSQNGRCQAKRFFRVTNSHRKRGGPVAVSLNLYTCAPESIEIVLDGKTVNSAEALREMLRFINNHSPRGHQSTETTPIPSSKQETERLMTDEHYWTQDEHPNGPNAKACYA
jgi:hypothetical protein